MNGNSSNPNSSRRDFLRQSALAAAGLMAAPALAAGAGKSEARPEAPSQVPEAGFFHQQRDFAALPQDRWPGRLVVGGKTLDDFVAIKEEPRPAPAWSLRVFQSESVPEWQIRAQWRVIGPVTEWISFLVNNAPKRSGRVTELRSLAASWPVRGPVDFYGNKGSTMALDDFADRTEQDIKVVELMPERGRSSDGVLPFFALTDRHDSLALGIGWSGRWCAKMRQANGALELEVGLPQVGFVLRPWESVRLPSILLARAPGASADHARRLVRAHLTKHIVPKAADGKSPNFTAASMMYDYLHGGKPISEEGEIALVERAATLGMENYWVDATWNGNTTEWYKEVGNWRPRASDLPRGLRPSSDRAHELGMTFTFWIEPERANFNSEWARAHPDLFLCDPDDHSADKNYWNPMKEGLLLNLGDPRAVDFAFTEISALIKEFNADVLRRDFNIQPLAPWVAADAPDRVGITEIRYIEGFYALWDRLLAAHPGLLIENVASGGRLIDLETMRRAMPLWRSDYLHADIRTSKMDHANQIHGWGLGHWAPDSQGLILSFEAYSVRSVLSTGFMPYFALPTKGSPGYADAIAGIAETKRLRSIMWEERIGLIAPSPDKEAWCAYQHHRHSDSSGIIIALRGPAADDDSATLRPEHIEPNRTYRVTRWDDYAAASPVKMAGKKLGEMLVKIPKKRGSVLIEYELG